MTESTLELQIASHRQEADGICSLELVDPEGRPLPSFTAGAHVDVYLPAGLVRQYSLCSPPQDVHRYRIAVLREAMSRGGSAAIHALRKGERLRIGAPRNLFPVDENAKHHLLLAGGIGITPLLCMAYALAHRRAPFTLHYCTRSRARAAFAEELTANFSERVRFHFDDGPEEQRLSLDAMLADCPDSTHFYVCGPAGFIDHALGAAKAAGWTEARLHREYFAARTAPSGASDDEGFEVCIASSGRIVQVPAKCSVVQALHEEGIELPVSCEQGICGTCIVRILEGTPDHRDMFLTAEEQAAGDRFTPCCSRARTPRLVLDL